MTNEATGGVSKRSLVLLGAFAALALNRDVRRSLVQGTRDAMNTAHDTLDDTVKPALNSAAYQAGQTIGTLREGAAQTIDTLREEGPDRAHSLLETAQEVAGTVAATAASRAAQARKDAQKAAKRARKEYGPRLSALSDDLLSTAENARKEAEKAAKRARKEYGPRVSHLSEDLRDLADDRRHDAQKALKQARKTSRSLIGQLGQKAGTLLDDVQNTIQDERDDIEHRLNRARRQAEKELRRGGKKWNAKKLNKAIERQIAPMQKEASKQLALLEKQAHQKTRKYRRAEPRRASLGGTTGTLLVLSGGAIALARLPQARQAIMDAVEGFSPDAANKLHTAGTQIRSVVGDFWIERDAVKTSTALVPYDQHKTETNTDFSNKSDLDSRPPAADKNGSPTRNN